jgi:hypothetical protein
MKTPILTLIGITLLASCQSEVEKIEENISHIQVANDSLWKELDKYKRLSDMTYDSVKYEMGDKELLLSKVMVYETTESIILEVISENQQDIKELREKQRRIQHGLEEK